MTILIGTREYAAETYSSSRRKKNLIERKRERERERKKGRERVKKKCTVREIDVSIYMFMIRYLFLIDYCLFIFFLIQAFGSLISNYILLWGETRFFSTN